MKTIFFAVLYRPYIAFFFNKSLPHHLVSSWWNKRRKMWRPMVLFQVGTWIPWRYMPAGCTTRINFRLLNRYHHGRIRRDEKRKNKVLEKSSISRPLWCKSFYSGSPTGEKLWTHITCISPYIRTKNVSTIKQSFSVSKKTVLI